MYFETKISVNSAVKGVEAVRSMKVLVVSVVNSELKSLN